MAFYWPSIDTKKTGISKLNSQRQHYLDAKEALKNEDLRSYSELKKQLGNYPLLPYLEYQELLLELPNKPYTQVDAFLKAHENSYLGDLLLKKWLNLLAQEKRWHEYRSYYDKKITSAPEQCLYIWSLVQTGEPQALTKAATLWNVGNWTQHHRRKIGARYTPVRVCIHIHI